MLYFFVCNVINFSALPDIMGAGTFTPFLIHDALPSGQSPILKLSKHKSGSSYTNCPTTPVFTLELDNNNGLDNNMLLPIRNYGSSDLHLL